MAEMFGHRWTSSYGLDPSPTWQEGLADLSVEELRTGVEALRNWIEDWPPTLPQFRALCRPHTNHAAHEFYQPLPAPTTEFGQRQAAAFAAIQALREGVLKPPEPARRTLSAEDRALLEQLDWERIYRAALPSGTEAA